MKKTVFYIVIVASLMLVALPTVSCVSQPEVTSLEVSPAVCFPGEEVTVSATLVSNGISTGGYTVRLFVDNALERSQTVSVTPGTAQPFSFALTRTQSGTYSVQIGDQQSSLLVLSASNLTITPAAIQTNEPVTITADLSNESDNPVDYHCSLLCQGEEVDTQDVTIPANSTEMVSFTLAQADSGIYEVSLLGLAGSFEVLQSAKFVVSTLEISPNPAAVGQEVSVTVGIDNTGEVEGTYQASLLADGVAEHSWEVTLAPGDDTALEVLTVSRDTPGDYQIEIGQQQETLSIIEPSWPRSGTYLVRELDNGYCKLQIMNRADQDLVVALTTPEDTTHAVIAMYVRADDIYTIQRIPPGIYYLFYVFGKDWDGQSEKFINDTIYSKGIHYYEFTEEGVKITKWTITFTQDNVDLASAWNITEAEFPTWQ